MACPRAHLVTIVIKHPLVLHNKPHLPNLVSTQLIMHPYQCMLQCYNVFGLHGCAHTGCLQVARRSGPVEATMAHNAQVIRAPYGP